MTSTATIAASEQAGAAATTADGEHVPGPMSELLNTGKFAEYHLQKAKAAFADGDFAAADYQAAASLCHDRLAEAVALRAEIKSRAKSR